MIVCCKFSEEAELFERALSLCGEKRQRKVGRISNTKTRNESIAAGLLLRYCLLKNGYDDDRVVISESGKPYIEGDRIFFSLSHSGEYAACSVENVPVGIDIQRIVDIKPAAVSRFCTEKEAEYLKNSSDAATDAVKLWALKESWLKASGCSTKQAFETGFMIKENGIQGPEGYVFIVDESIPGYIVAVCRAI